MEECPGLVAFSEEKIDAFADEPVLAAHFEETRARLVEFLEGVEQNPPNSPVKLGEVCYQVSQILEPALEGAEELKPRGRSKLLSAIAKARHDVSKHIIKDRRNQGEWRGLRWKTRRLTVQNVYDTISANLGFPAKPPPKDSSEWYEARRKILNITARNFNLWGITAAIVGNKWFSSHLDVLIAVFDEHYSIADEFDSRKHRYCWRSPEETISNVREKVTDELDLPSPPPPPDSPRWHNARRKILNITARDFTVWGIGAAFSNNAWFSSYIDVMIAAFDKDYSIAEELDSKKNEHIYHWRSLEETVGNVREKVTEELGLPSSPPPHDSPEWHNARNKLLDVNVWSFKKWGLARAYEYNKWFSSYADVMIAAFDKDYSIAEELKSKKYSHIYHWRSLEETVGNVREKVTEELDLPSPSPLPNSLEWHNARRKIIGITARDFNLWRLTGAITDNAWFSSHLDVLIEAFDEDYSIAEELDGRRKIYSWQSPEETVGNVREKVNEELGFPSSPPPHDSPEWHDARRKIIGIRFKDFEKWGIVAASTNNKWFSSYGDVLIEAFPEFKFQQWHFSPLARSAFNIAHVNPTAAITAEDLLLIQTILAAENNDAMHQLVDCVYHIPAGRNRQLEYDEQRSMALERMLKDIHVMREECPVNLRTLWLMANSYVRKIVVYESLQGKIPVKVRPEIQSPDSPFSSVDELDVLLDFKKSLDLGSLDYDQRTELYEYIADEISAGGDLSEDEIVDQLRAGYFDGNEP